MSRSNDFSMKNIQPRDYQIELLDHALSRNTIISLGAGTGKTFVAALLVKEYSHRLVQNKEKAVFLVNNAPLVEQQASHIEFHSTLNVARLCGGLNRRKYDKNELEKILSGNQVIVITAQVFVDFLNHGLITLSSVALLIVDECHHCLAQHHPYRLIMNHYRQMTGERPRILGLTASVLNKKVPLSRIELTIQRLEKIMISHLETASDYTMVCKYAAKPKQFVVCTKDNCTTEKFVVNSLERLRSFVDKNADFQSELDIDPRRPILEAISRAFSTLQQVGSWCALKGCILWQKKLFKLKDDQILEQKQRCILRTAETTFRTCIKVLSHKVNSINSLAKLTNPENMFLSDRARKLLEILKNYTPSRREQLGIQEALSGIIFVNERFTAFMINTLLKFLTKLAPDDFGHLKVDFLVGHTGTTETEDEDRRLANRKQEQTLHKFRNGQLNLLVATNVLEEGIDIRNCNLVVRFDPPVDFRSYVQSSGRARKENSAFYILVQESDYVNFMSDLKGYAQTEEFILKRYRCGNELTSTTTEGEEDILPHPDEMVPPYVVELPNGTCSKIGLSGAIQLVNRYCSKLPSDVFTRLVPHYTVHAVQTADGHTMYRAELILPINSPVKEAITTKLAFSSKRMALKAVALEACKLLHQRKELNDHLLPTGKEIVMDLLGELDDDEYLPYLLNKTGSSKKKRLYDRKMAKALSMTLPAQEEECFLYIIEMKLIRPISEENNPKKRKIIDPFETNSAFGFLSSKELPTIPGFPVFQRQGEMLVQIRRAKTNPRLNFELFNLVCHFHQHIFEDILRIARSGVVFAPGHSQIPLLVVPLKRVGQTDLDYGLDQTYLNWTIRDAPTVPSDEVRRNFVFEPTRYTNAVVNPWYRSEDQCAFYFVAEILREQFPASAFPDSKFTNFNEYFKNKYHLEIYNQNQNLLDVDHTSARMNLLLPRASSGKPAKKPLDPSQQQILVPELVHIHPLSAPLWTMIVALPTVLYRINSLLLADEFRIKVMQDALKLDAKTPPNQFEWNALHYATQNCDQTEQQIKSLEQLKRINQEGKLFESEAKATKRSKNDDGQLDMDVDGVGEGGEQKTGFEIGVWDPSDGFDNDADQPSTAAVQQQSPLQNGLKPRNGLRMNPAREEEISELIAIGNDSTIRNYGHISDDEDDIEYDNFKFLMHNKITDIDLGDVQCAEAGWGDDEDLENKNIHIENENLPLTISRNNPHINIESLMNDLERNFAGVGGGGGATTTPDAAAKSVPITPKTPPTLPATTKKQLHLDPLQAMDEVDRRESAKRTDEMIPEEVYWEEEEEGRSGNASPEFGLHPIPTKRPDSPNALNGFCEVQKFEIMAPELSWMPFSFMQNLLLKNPHGVSPALLLQALTTSSAADGVNLERLETIGDSFLKMAVTNFLYHMHNDQHEGKLSFARSKEVSNSRLFFLGRQRGIPLLMETLKFDPHVNWLPPCYASTSEFHAVNPLDYSDLMEEQQQQNEMDMEGGGRDKENDGTNIPTEAELREKDARETGWGSLDDDSQHYKCENGVETITFPQQNKSEIPDLPPMPYNMLTQQWISDKSIADAVEALIGAHLIQLGQQATLKFMHWLGIKVLTEPPALQSPLLRFIDTEENPQHSLTDLMLLYNKFDFATVENAIGYKFANKAYLIQAFTHASYFHNRVTGCYQRLEFLGDAILDYMITRFLYEHKKQYSPGVLTDLRSALVNNTIFASLAIKYNFHKHFVMLCPPLHQMIGKFVNFCKLKDFSHCANFDDEIFMVTEEEIDEGHEEDVEVPKAMGDIFESMAGAVYLDCGMDLDIVWRVFYNLMREVIQKCCDNPPQSPVRELFERKNCRAKFSKLERKLDTGKVRVTVTINDNSNIQFTGMGRSYRLAKSTAAKRALMYLRKLDAAKGAAAEKNRKDTEEAVKVP